jgi:polar amino acid transport system substrate-binding protein
MPCTRRAAGAGAVLVTTVSLVLGGCADPSSGGSGGSSHEAPPGHASARLKKDPQAAKLVPQKYRERGTLRFGALLTGAPMMYKDESGDINGAEKQLVEAVGQVLGLKITMKEASTDGVVPGVASGRFDFVAGSLTDIKEREKTVDFVVYANYGQALLAKAQNAGKVGFDKLCGKAVAVAKGSIQQIELLPKIKERCLSDWEKAPTAKVFPDANALYLAVNSGRVDTGFLNEVTIRYQAKQSKGAMKVADTGFGSDPKGMAIAKDSGLVKPILAAMKVIQDEGVLSDVFKKWGIKTTMLPQPQVNAAVR